MSRCSPAVGIRLPEEIIALIVWQALAVNALDTSIGCTYPLARSEMLFALEERMSTKLALSLVSRTVHALSAHALYEDISVYDPRRIKPLVAALRRSCRFASQPHGHYCRRLDIDIIYNRPEWGHGAASLWGLLLACPKLEILNVNIYAQVGGATGATPVNGMFHCPLSLIIQIAELYGPRLRRLELRGDICVYAGAVAFLGSSCPLLEVLCVPGLFVARDPPRGYLSDADDPLDRLVLMEQRQVDEAQLAMDPAERAYFLAAHSKATRWRLLCDEEPVFPALHTLDIGNYASHTSLWHLPALAVLHLSFRDIMTFMERTITSYTDECEVQADVLSARGQNLVAWTYSGIDLDVFAQLDKLPKLKHLALEIIDDPESDIAHAGLRELDLVVSADDTLWSWIGLILKSVERGDLPELRVIRLMMTYARVAQSTEFMKSREALAGHGILLQITKGNLMCIPMVFHVPALLTQLPQHPTSKRSIRFRVQCFAERYPEIVENMPTYREWLPRLNGPGW